MSRNRRPQSVAALGFPFQGWSRSFKFLTPDANEPGPGGAGGTPSGQAGGEPNPQPNPDLIPRSEAAKAFKDRDAAKQQAKRSTAMVTALAGRLGIDPAELQLVETGDAENPFELKGESLDQLAATLTDAQKLRLDRQKKQGDWDSREKELTEAWTKKLGKATAETEQKFKTDLTAAQKRFAALEKYIDETAVDGPIRDALAAERAVHDGNGNYGDLVDLIKPRVKREIAIDEETGKVAVNLVPLADDGTPLIRDGKTADLRAMVADWLGKRPQFRQSTLRSGPGAGGRGVGGQPGGGANTRGNGTVADRGTEAARRIFGDAYVPGGGGSR